MPDKKVSKIPKLCSSPTNQLKLESSDSKSTISSSLKANQTRIFEAKNLNTACDFLNHLKTKLKNDVSEEENNQENATKVSEIVSSILSNINEDSDDLPTTSNYDENKETSGKLLKVNKTSSVLSETGKCFYMAQELTVSHLHKAKIKEKPVVDKQFLQQLTNLQALLQETINKLEDKSTLTQINNKSKETRQKFCKSIKQKDLPLLVQVEHESKPPKNKEQLESKNKSSKELKIDEDEATELILKVPPNSEVTNSTTGPIIKQKSCIHPSSGDVTSPELSDYEDYPGEYKYCLSENEEKLKKDSKPKTKRLPSPQTSIQPLQSIQESKNSSSKETTLKTPPNSSIKLSPRNSWQSPLTSKTSTTRKLSLKSNSSKNISNLKIDNGDSRKVLNKKVDDKKCEKLSKDKNKRENKKDTNGQIKENNLNSDKLIESVNEKDNMNKKVSKSYFTPFKSIKRNSDKRICSGSKESVKTKSSEIRKKILPQNASNKTKENLDKRKTVDKKLKDKANKIKSKEALEEEVAINVSSPYYNSNVTIQMNKKSSEKDLKIEDIPPPVIETEPVNDVTIPPPPLFNYDSYVDVQPYNDSIDSLLNMSDDKSKTSKINQVISSHEQPIFVPEIKRSSIQYAPPPSKGTGSQVIKKSVSIQDDFVSSYIHQGTGSSCIFKSNIDRGINNNIVQMHYPVQVPSKFGNFQESRTSISTDTYTDTPGKSLEQLNVQSRSVSVFTKSPITQSQIVQVAYETQPVLMTPNIETTSTEVTATASITDTGTGDGQPLINSNTQEDIKVNPLQLIDPQLAKLRCSNCMCVIGGPSVDTKQSDALTDDVEKLKEVEILHKDSPQKYINQVIQEINMMKNCIESAMENQQNNNTIKAYLDDGRIVKSKYPHFHTLIDGIPVILIWTDDPKTSATHLQKKRSKNTDKKTKKGPSIKTKKFFIHQRPSTSNDKQPMSGDSSFLSDRKRNVFKTKVLLDHLANTVAKCTTKNKGKYKCDECGNRCPGRLNKKDYTCTNLNTIPQKTSHSSKDPKEDNNLSAETNPKENKNNDNTTNKNVQEEISGCKCDNIPSKFRSRSPKPCTRSSTRFRSKSRCLFNSTDEESEKSKGSKRPKTRRRFEKNKSTNIPSKTEAKSIQTYYLLPRPPQRIKRPCISSKDSDESENDMPYLIDAKSLPQFEHPDTVCSSKLFDVKQIDCELRDEIKTKNQSVKDTLLRINLNALLDSFRPAKCCQKTVLNGRTRSTYPYPASLQSLPLSEEDLDRILQIIQSNNRKRFDTPKRLFESDFSNFQTENEPNSCLVYFFELFRKSDCKTSLATTSTSSSSSSRTIVPTPAKHDLKIFEFIRRIYNSHPISDKRVIQNKKDSTKTLYRHHSTHRKHKRHHRSRHHHRPKRKQRNISTSMARTASKSTSIVSLPIKPSRNISFLLIPKSELNNYFCGEINSMYTPSLNSLPFDDSDQQIQSNHQLISKDFTIINEGERSLTSTEYARTLGAIYETEESENDFVRESKEIPCSISAYNIQNSQISQMTNLQLMACRLSSPLNNSSKDFLDEMPSTSSSFTNCPNCNSDLTNGKHIFSNNSILTNESSTKIPISCLPLNCPISNDGSSFLNLPSIISDTRRFLYRQKEEIFKPSLDKIVENSSNTTSTLSSSLSKRKRKSLKNCALSLKPTTSRIERHIPESLMVSGDKRDKKNFHGYDFPFSFEMVPQNERKSKSRMKLDKAVVAYHISPSSEFKFLSEDGTKPKLKENKFKSENICVWPVFQSRKSKKRNSGFVVSIHSSDIRLGNKGSIQSNNQSNTLNDYCEFYRKKRNLSNYNFLVGYIGEEIKPTMNKKLDSASPQRTSSSKKDRQEKNEKEKTHKSIEKVKERPSSEKKKQPDASLKVEKKKSSKKNLRPKVVVRKPSIKVIPEVIDIKIPTNVKSTRLKHKFCDKGDRPGYVTVLSTPCNCPDVTIFIPCYCSYCDGKTTRQKTDSNYTMVPIVEKSENES